MLIEVQNFLHSNPASSFGGLTRLGCTGRAKRLRDHHCGPHWVGIPREAIHEARVCQLLHPVADRGDRTVERLLERKAVILPAQIEVPPSGSELPMSAEVILDRAHQLPGKG